MTEGTQAAPTIETLVDVLVTAARRVPDRGIVHLEEPGCERTQTYPQLLADAEHVMTALRARGLRRHDRVILLLEDTHPFVTCFWGCLLAGVVPVPLGTLEAGRTLASFVDRVARVHQRLEVAAIVTRAALQAVLAESAQGAGFTVFTPDELQGALEPADSKPVWTPTAPDETAMIQCSSGSTGHPKGVGLSHENLIADVEGILDRGQYDPDGLSLSWVPLHHDMGLVGFHLSPIRACGQQALMRTADFARSPLRWLRELSARRATVTSSPTFGLQHVLRRLKPALVSELDLSSVETILTGAEPISAAVVREFNAALAPAGLARTAMRGAYGLAEATLAVALGAPGEELGSCVCDRNALAMGARVTEVDPGDPRAVEIVFIGAPILGC
ncbi:MAG: AMP-binding protein, partial [Planctomycetota bacterium]